MLRQVKPASAFWNSLMSTTRTSTPRSRSMAAIRGAEAATRTGPLTGRVFAPRASGAQ